MDIASIILQTVRFYNFKIKLFESEKLLFEKIFEQLSIENC